MHSYFYCVGEKVSAQKVEQAQKRFRVLPSPAAGPKSGTGIWAALLAVRHSWKIEIPSVTLQSFPSPPHFSKRHLHFLSSSLYFIPQTMSGFMHLLLINFTLHHSTSMSQVTSHLELYKLTSTQV